MKNRLIEKFKESIINGNSSWKEKNEVHTITENKTDISIIIKNYNIDGSFPMFIICRIKDNTQNKKYSITKKEYFELLKIYDDNYQL